MLRDGRVERGDGVIIGRRPRRGATRRPRAPRAALRPASREVLVTIDQRHKRRRKLASGCRGPQVSVRGRHSIAMADGTRWLTVERCDGTLTRVDSGTVSVRDFERHKTVPCARAPISRESTLVRLRETRAKRGNRRRTIVPWPFPRRACAGCAARPSCATSCARRGCDAGRPRPAAVRRGRPRAAARRSTRCPASTACRSPRPSTRRARPRRSACPACCCSASRRDKDAGGHRRVGRRGHRPARHARDQGRAIPTCSSSPTSACASTPSHGHCGAAARPTARVDNDASRRAARAHRGLATRAPAPTSSRRAT